MDIKKHYFIFVIMLFLLGTTGVIMGGCQKDYDGQLEIIRNQIKSGEISLDNLYSKVTLIDEQVTALQKALEEVETTEEHKKDIQEVLKKLDDVKAELEGSIVNLEKKIADNNEELIGIKDLIQSLEEQFNDKLLAISIDIQRIDIHLDYLDGRVNALEEQVKALKDIQEAIQNKIADLEEKIANGDKHSQEQIDELKKAVADLTDVQDELTTKIDGLTEQVKNIATDVQRHESEIKNVAQQIANLTIKIEQVMADNAVEFEDLWNAINEIKAKYAEWDGKFGELNNKFNALESEYRQKIAELEELIGKVDPTEISKEIEDIKQALNDLSEGVATNKADIISTNNIVTDVKTQVEKLNEVVTEHEQRISTIEKEVESIKEDIKNLFNRIQSMVIIPQYTGNYIKLESKNNDSKTTYELTMEVDIRPFDIAKAIEMGSFSISVKSVEPTPTRATTILPTFTITSKIADEEKHTFTITASASDIENVGDYSVPMKFQVALALNDVDKNASKNDRLSEYMGVYYVAPGSVDVDVVYDFYKKTKEGGEEKLTVIKSIPSSETIVYSGNFLNEQGNFLDQPYPIFEDATIIAKKSGFSEEEYNVDFSIAAAATTNDVVDANLANCFAISSSGFITQTQDASQYAKTLKGVKIFIGLQAKKNSTKYGKHCYICVKLGDKESQD